MPLKFGLDGLKTANSDDRGGTPLDWGVETLEVTCKGLFEELGGSALSGDIEIFE